MNLAFLQVIFATHVAFALAFGFFFWQARTRFAGALTLAWLVQAVRTIPVLRQAGGAQVSLSEWLAGDLLLPLAMWCLLVSGAALGDRRIRTRWGAAYFGVSGAVVTVAHLWGAAIVQRVSALAPERAAFWSVFLRFTILFVPAGLICFWLAAALFRCWRSRRLPGALIASAAAIVYGVGIAVLPAQWWFAFQPSWANLAWFLQILGMSTGFLILILNLEHAALQRSQENVRRLHGLLPICAWCKKVRDDDGYWREIEVYVRSHSEADFTHGLCPECGMRLMEDAAAHPSPWPRRASEGP